MNVSTPLGVAGDLPGGTPAKLDDRREQDKSAEDDVTGEYLPKEGEKKMPYYLNKEKMNKKMAAGAVMKDFIVVTNSDSSLTITFGTGACGEVAIPLMLDLASNKGKTYCKAEVGSLEVTVVEVKQVKVDANGLAVERGVGLLVEGKTVTVTLYVTSRKMLVQGSVMATRYAKETLLPYLQEQVKTRAVDIKNMNRVYTSTPKGIKEKKGVQCAQCAKTFTTRTQLETHLRSHEVGKPKGGVRVRGPTRLMTAPLRAPAPPAAPLVAPPTTLPEPPPVAPPVAQLPPAPAAPPACPMALPTGKSPSPMSTTASSASSLGSCTGSRVKRSGGPPRWIHRIAAPGCDDTGPDARPPT